MGKKLIYVIGLTAILITAIWAWLYLKIPRMIVTNFEECIGANYPVIESYPRQCKTPDGEVFTEDIGNELEKKDLIQITRDRKSVV